ncbi:hypothetical protein F442_12040 [Phytophthora nicotianae P10297]|uniref:Uncharacterized protein n=2 Tax=Phytophthora nicotianae TaxID=4792 RepID=W2Z0U0_PHYNI|nr:hypothetical protein F442_12040 [Phytophthora nicotianae P10297]
MDFEDPELGRLDHGDWVKDYGIGDYDNMVDPNQNQASQIRTLRNGFLSVDLGRWDLDWNEIRVKGHDDDLGRLDQVNRLRMTKISGVWRVCVLIRVDLLCKTADPGQ